MDDESNMTMISTNTYSVSNTEIDDMFNSDPFPGFDGKEKVSDPKKIRNIFLISFFPSLVIGFILLIVFFHFIFAISYFAFMVGIFCMSYGVFGIMTGRIIGAGTRRRTSGELLKIEKAPYQFWFTAFSVIFLGVLSMGVGIFLSVYFLVS